MKAKEFWKKVSGLKFLHHLCTANWLTTYEKGDSFTDSKVETHIENVIYAVNNTDEAIGSVLFMANGRIDGSIAVINAERYNELIETMKKIQHGELEMGEVLTNSEEWKRDVFKYIFNKKGTF